jgi:excisionase family DNA binding protein
VRGVPPAEGLTVDEERPLSGDRLLTVSEVASTMRVSNMTVYRMIKSGALSALRVGKNYRVRESELESYLSHHSVQVEGS